MPLSDDERFKIEYSEVGNYIRHYSSVRSALTSFLVTVGLAAFATYSEQNLPFAFFAGWLMIISAVIACLLFSYRTERSDLYLTELWNWSKEAGRPYPVGFKSFKPGPEVCRKIFSDLMNWVMIVGAASILVVAFSS